MPLDQLKFQKKVEQWKKELTFDYHKRMVEDWSRQVQGMIVRSEVAKTDGIKELLKKIKEKIHKCNMVLQNDRNLTEKERDILFARKDEQIWLISFFEDAEKIVKNAPKKVDKELKRLSK